MIKRSFGEKVFDTVNVLLLILVAVITLYPFWYVLVASVSNPDTVSSGQVVCWPIGFELASYVKVFNMDYIWTSYGNTIYIAVVGTVVNLICTILTAFPFSRKRMYGRNFFTWMMLITMWFGAGMMPSYLNLKNLGLLNNLNTLIIFGCINSFYVILMRTYFESISDSLEESAKIDGASDWTVLFRIFLPLSVPSLMTIGLYYFVDRWNAFFWAMIIIRDEWKVPLQVILKKLIVQTQLDSENMDVSSSVVNQQTIIYATIMVATIPMICIYPFVQKFFVKGVMIGAVKG